ncbi:hypothetical protein [Nocardioides acrostichi]|uniref:DUF1570 domain-containing protein n=1 Tax=Nocardioides acrostichi TaxID=2784339 RepID=A0A930V4A5_9ACTN|nr:hypothetical protein [Nocardioides acrostichi]MBF4162949.1 hypothetical protein [Nocardioides acrostichi]
MAVRPVPGRRAFVLGAGLVVLGGCSRSGDAPETTSGSPGPTAGSSGPIVQQQQAGTIITPEDLDGIVDRMDAAVHAGDAAALRAVVPDLPLAQWRHRLRSMSQFPLTDLGFVFERANDRFRNASGGALEVTASLVLTHRLKGCDARLSTQSYDIRLSKEGADAPLQVADLSGPIGDQNPWDLPGTWEVLESEHVVLICRAEHLDVARARLAAVDAGIVDAMQFIAPAKGTSRLAFTLDEPQSKVYGGGAVDRGGFATRVDFIDPQVAATAAGKSTRVKGDRIFAGARVVVRPDGLDSTPAARELSAHEAIHALALQWAPFAAPWVAEGLAEWVSVGTASGIRNDGYAVSLIRSRFAGFADRFQGFDASWDDALFQKQDDTTVYANYLCSAAIYAMVEETRGRDAALALGRALYEDDVESGPGTAGWGSQRALFDRTAQWVESL